MVYKDRRLCSLRRLLVFSKKRMDKRSKKRYYEDKQDWEKFPNHQ